jgi:Subtilase family
MPSAVFPAADPVGPWSIMDGPRLESAPTFAAPDSRISSPPFGGLDNPPPSILASGFNGSISPGGLTPTQITGAYDERQSFGGVAGTGSGQTIAIVDAYDDPDIAADLAAFDSYWNLPAPPAFTKLNEAGGTVLPGEDPNEQSSAWGIEESLDVEWAHAEAPGASIVLYEASSDYDSDLFAAVDTAALQGSAVVSMSWQGGEFYAEQQYDNDVFVDPANQQPYPTVILASSGDSGNPGYPSVSPDVLSVGGTTLDVTAGGQYIGESPWSGSGSGPSAYEPQPTFQAGTAPLGNRYTPDVAFDADPNSGVALYDSYDLGDGTPWLAVGGTSFSAPSFAAEVAIADQFRAASGKAELTTLQIEDIVYGGTIPNSLHSIGGVYEPKVGLGTPDINLTAELFQPVGADPNLAGQTNFASLQTLFDNYGQSTLAWSQGDFDGGGTVDFHDLELLLENYQ